MKEDSVVAHANIGKELMLMKLAETGIITGEQQVEFSKRYMISVVKPSLLSRWFHPSIDYHLTISELSSIITDQWSPDKKKKKKKEGNAFDNVLQLFRGQKDASDSDK